MDRIILIDSLSACFVQRTGGHVAGWLPVRERHLRGVGLPALRSCTPADLIDPDRQQPFSASISPQATSPDGGGRGCGLSTKALAVVAVVAVALLVLAATTVEMFALSWRRWRRQRVVAGGSPSTAGGDGTEVMAKAASSARKSVSSALASLEYSNAWDPLAGAQSGGAGAGLGSPSSSSSPRDVLNCTEPADQQRGGGVP
jgi:hypothetical protein